MKQFHKACEAGGMPGSCARGIDTPITGEPGNADHVRVVGKMFMETNDHELWIYHGEGAISTRRRPPQR